jgi:hypothetical protein
MPDNRGSFSVMSLGLYFNGYHCQSYPGHFHWGSTDLHHKWQIQTASHSTIVVDKHNHSGMKDYFKDQGGEANIMPKEGDEVTIAETKSKHVWARLNFADLVEMKQIGVAVGGNELDILCWGGQGPNNTQEYMVTYLKWDNATKAKFTFGSDDSSESYFNGEELHSFPADVNWGAGNAGTHEADVIPGEWNILVVGAYETGGEWGITVRVDPIPDEVNNVGPAVLFAVEPMDKLPITWGKIKE